MGESYGAWRMGDDERIMPLVDLANVACGAHASDPQTMQATLALAQRHQVAIGAHPGYPDREGFGRRDFPLHGDALKAWLWHQIGALDGQCRAQGVKLKHVKPHGALYNKMMRDRPTLLRIIEAVAAYNPALPLVVQAGSSQANKTLQALAAQHAVQLWFEAFADRAYDDQGQLAPRSQAGAVHEHSKLIVDQARQLMQQHSVTSTGGQRLDIAADTLCFHGDNPACPAALEQLRQ